jgi:LAO/AO transport system kinase
MASIPLRLPLETYIQGILNGDRTILSRAITLIESRLESDRTLAQEVIAATLSQTGNAFRIGITGVPGVGKSTFIDSFGSLLTSLGIKVAVLAVDPSSEISGGSILGDKTRMERLSCDPDAFIRPSPAAGSLGGVARNTRETLLLCEAAGYEVILVETVGVGQSEVAVHRMVDFFLLLMLANAGDELQGMKKGIIEMADALVINKADGNMMAKARTAKAGYSQALRLFPRQESGWEPPVMLCSAIEKTGIAEIWDMLARYRSQMQESSRWNLRRKKQAVSWMRDTVRYQLEDRFFNHPAVKALVTELEADVMDLKRSPIEAAEALLRIWEAQFLRKE